MEALKYTIDFVKTCNLEMLYLVFRNEVSLRHLNFLFSNTLFTHFYDAITFHSYDANYGSMVLHYDRCSWVIFMLRCENHYFQIKEDYFCGLLDCAFTFLNYSKKNLVLTELDLSK